MTWPRPGPDPAPRCTPHDPAPGPHPLRGPGHGATWPRTRPLILKPLGALYASRGRKPAARVRLALEAAERFSASVRGPFTIAKAPR